MVKFPTPIPCPSCGTQAFAFAEVDGATRCPMCAPVPGRTPHDFRPLPTGGGSGCDPQLAARARLRAEHRFNGEWA